MVVVVAVAIVAAAIIVGVKRKLFYGCGYGAISTMPCRMWFFVNTGPRGL